MPDFSKYLETAPTVEPFVLNVENREPITIQPPTGESALNFDDATSSRARLAALCGDQFDAVFELVRFERAPVLDALVRDISAHFRVGG